MIGLDRLSFDVTVPDNGANVGAYLRDSVGALITSTLIGAKQSLDVNVVVGADDGVFAEDSVHTTADNGTYVLSVREDTLASSTSATGDYQSFKTDALGRLWANRSGQSAAYGAVSIADTATDIIGTDLANRIKVIVQNTDNKNVFLGSNASVTTVNGLRLSAGSSIELEVGAGVNLHGITATGVADVRYFEVA